MRLVPIPLHGLAIVLFFCILSRNYVTGQLNLQNLMPLLGTLNSLKGSGGGGGGGLGSLLGGGGGATGGGGGSGLDLGALLQMVGPMLGGGSGGGGGALSGLLGGAGGGGGGGGAGLASLLASAGSGGGGASGLSGLLGGAGGGGGSNALSGLLAGAGGGGGGSNALSGLLSGGGSGGGLGALQSLTGGGGLGGGGGSGGGIDPAMLQSLISKLQSQQGGGGGLGGFGGSQLQGLGSGFGGSQGMGGALSGLSSGGFSNGGSGGLMSSGSNHDAQLMQMLGNSQSQSFGQGSSQSSPNNLISAYLGGSGQGGDGDLGNLDLLASGSSLNGMGSSRNGGLSAGVIQHPSPSMTEFWSKETKPCFVDGYKGSCMPISLTGVCKLYNYQIRDGGCINFQTMSRDVCCYRLDADSVIDPARRQQMLQLQQQASQLRQQSGPGPQFQTSSSNFSPAGADSLSQQSQQLPAGYGPALTGSSGLPISFGSGGSGSNLGSSASAFSPQILPNGFSQTSQFPSPAAGQLQGLTSQGLNQSPPVNPIQSTITNAMGAQLQAASAGSYPPSVMNMVMGTLQNPRSQNPTQIATGLIDSFLSMSITTPQPPVTAALPAQIGPLPQSIASKLPANKLSLFQSATAGMTHCSIDSSQGFCMPPMMQTVCQNMKLKISSQGCAAGQICCAQSADMRIPDDIANSVQNMKKGKMAESDDMLAQGSSQTASRIPFMPEGRARKACTVSGFDGICVATSLTALCPGLGMQVSDSGCESSESCCYSSDTAASNIDTSVLKEEPLAISFDQKKPAAEARSPPFNTAGMLQAPSVAASVIAGAAPAAAASPAAASPAAAALAAAAPAFVNPGPAQAAFQMPNFDIPGIVRTIMPMFLSANKGADGGGLGGLGGLTGAASNVNGLQSGQNGLGGSPGVCGGAGEAASCISQDQIPSCVRMGYKTRMGGCIGDQLCCYTPTNELEKDSSFRLDSAAKCVIQDHPGICMPASAARNCSLYNLEVSLYGCSSPDLNCCYTRNSVNGQCGIKGKGSATPTYGATYGSMGLTDSLTIADPDFADVGENCWQAALLDRSSGNYFCSAVLIDSIWLLTAAHCVAKRSPMDITVRLGEWDFNVTTEVPGPRDYSVFNLYIHSSFNTKTLENDIAMLKLNRPADISLSNICLACRPGQIDYYGMNCQAGGWGKLGQNFPFSSRLKRIPTRIWPNQECAYRLKNSPLGPGFKFQTTSFMCGSGTGRQTICNGDGGGPLVCSVGGNYQLAGIIVSGIQCGQGGMPALFVNLGQYQAWIDEVMKN